MLVSRRKSNVRNATAQESADFENEQEEEDMGELLTIKSRRGAITVGTLIMLCLLVGIAVLGAFQYNKYKARRAQEAQRKLEEERAMLEKAEAERRAEEDRVRKEAEEREAKRKREREERETRMEKERQDRLRKEQEERESRQKAAEAEAAKECYRKASEAFANGLTAFYAEAPDGKRVGASYATYWYADESFTGDKRIYEIKNGTITILYPEKLTQASDGAAFLSSLESKPGLLAGGGNVWICGTGKGMKSLDVPEKGKSIVPFDCELGGLVDVALALGVNPPKNRYHVALRVKGSSKSIVVGTFRAIESVYRGKLEKTVHDELNRRLRDAKHSPSATAVDDYLATCEIVLKRTGAALKNATEEKAKRQKEPQACYRCRGKGVVKTRVRETCDECGGSGVIEKEVTLKDTKHTTDGYWNYRHVGTKKSVNRQTCQKCRRSGKVSVEKEVECPVCHGSGTR